MDAIHARLARIGELRKLGGLCHVVRGIPKNKVQSTEVGGVPFIERGVVRSGQIDFENAMKVSLDGVPQEVLLQDGDLLLSTTITDRSAPILQVEYQPAVLSENVVAIRPKTGEVSGEYLFQYLDSYTGKALLQQTANTSSFRPGMYRTTEAKVRDMLVPLIDPELLRGLNRINKTETRLRSSSHDLRNRRRSVFDAQNGRAFREDVAHVKRYGNVLANTIERAQTVAYQIANLYPFPIAYGYRLLAGPVSPTERHYKEQLRVAENLLAFLGSTALALLCTDEQRRASRIDVRSLWQGGINPGDWRELVIHASVTPQSSNSSDLVQELVRLDIGAGKGFGAAVDALIQAKNDFKHDRGPSTASEIETAVAEAGEHLDRCMKRLAFLTDYPIRRLHDYDHRRGGGQVVTYVEYVGDHPVFPAARTLVVSELPTKPAKKGDLYLTVDDNTWIPLFPYMTATDCRRCGATEIYFIDRWNESRGAATIKSFERGHTERSIDIAHSLSEWPRTEDDRAK